MMKLETMSDLMLACSGQQGKAFIEDIVTHWPYDQGTIKFVRVSANCVFTFLAAGEGFFLRINHASERTVRAWQAELAVIDALAHKGIHVARPIISRTGNYIESMQTICGELHAVVFEALPGRSYGEISDLSSELLIRWGKALGELHHAAQGYQAGKVRPTWQDHLTLIAECLPQNDAVARTELEQVRRALAQLPIRESNYGLIHYDFEQDNIIWDGDRPGIIDFDGCAWYWFTADIAFALRDLFDDRPDHVDLENETFRTFIAGYREVREIGDDELRQIPLFLRMHNLTTYAKLLRTLQTGKRDIEPVWMDGLREKLTGALQQYRENFM